jgi:hypothetical protein
MFFVGILILVLCPIVSHAKNIINENGIEITEGDYNNFIKIHSHEFIMRMDAEKYNHLKELDFTTLKTETKYIVSTYNPNLKLSTSREITEEEFNKFDISKENIEVRGSDYNETTSKRLAMSIVKGTAWDYVTLDLAWKKIPSTRSFDVIGFYADGMSPRNGSQHGEQAYTVNGQYNRIQYSWNGTNIKKFNNGYGISMNIVNNSNLQSLRCSTWADMYVTSNHGSLFGSYQHAVTNLTLANSKNYTLGSAGLGGVFIYPLNISQKYDGMAGTRIDF